MTETTINAAADVHGCEQKSLRKWARNDGIQPTRIDGRVKFYDPAALAACVANHKGNTAKKNKAALTWAQKKLREETRKLKRENEIEDALKAELWLTRELHEEILSKLVTKLEQIPGKARSEAGLTDAQTAIVRRMLDEARSDAAKEVREIKK